MKKTTTLICPVCNQEYQKANSEINRNNKLGRTSYCSLSCSIKSRQDKMQQAIISNNSRYDISKHCNNQADIYTPFRFILKCLKNSNRKDCLVDLEILRELWENQKGLCAFTQLPMDLPTHSNYKEIDFYKAASIDRIDNTLPYTKDNIQYVLRPLNYAKNNQSNDSFLQFLLTLSNIQLKVSLEVPTISSPL